MSSRLTPSRTLSDRYRLDEEIGRGAMGTVYRARDTKHDREVAVKILDAGPATEPTAARFLSEIRTAARLQHPNILTIHDSGEDEGNLYYVMPRVRGESLHERLEREGRLPLGEAVRIARATAAALAHAHARGVIHRDVKPENILLDPEGPVYLADFGIARALTGERSPRLTDPGLAVGSPLYMSPEQCTGTDPVDGRCDIYSLGCVLFEMLAGAPPFTGDSARSVIQRHLTEPPPSLRTRRGEIPPPLEDAVLTALAKDPEDRFDTADELAAGLAGVETLERGTRFRIPVVQAWGPWARALLTGAAVAVVLGAGLFVASGMFGEPPALDPDRVAVFPVRRGDGVSGEGDESRLLHAALGRWGDLDVLGPVEMRGRLLGGGGAPEDDEALAAARELGAGRYVLASLTPVRDSLWVRGALHDAAREGAPIEVATVVLAPGGEDTSRAWAVLVDSLLFGGLPDPGPPRYRDATSSAGAWTAFARGHGALELWDLTRADSLFSLAVERDAGFTRAQLWLGQVRHWLGETPPAWRTPVERALMSEQGLSRRERDLAAGLSHLARDEYGAACDAYEELRARDSRDFAAHYGLGECRRRDAVVVPDPSSPSGWSFRSSYHQAVEAYRTAFELLTTTRRGFRTGWTVPGVFRNPRAIRVGRREGDTRITFYAYPELRNDTLAYIPRREAMRHPPATRSQAISYLRRTYHDVAEGWVASFPDSPYALEALALSLEMLGDARALEVRRRARPLARDAETALRLAAGEIFLLVRLHGRDLSYLQTAVELADSLLATDLPSPDPLSAKHLSDVASLAGRPSMAADLARRAATPDPLSRDVPRSATAPADALLAFAAIGGPVDSIAVLEAATVRAIRNMVPEEDDSQVWSSLIARPAFLAFPEHVFQSFQNSSILESPVARAQAAFLRGDSAASRALLAEARRIRETIPPAERTIDVVYAEARLLLEVEGPQAAADWLDPVLGSLEWAQPGSLRQHRGAVLVRSMALRADLARRLGDPDTARRWARPVVILWSRGEPFLQPTLARMTTLLERS